MKYTPKQVRIIPFEEFVAWINTKRKNKSIKMQENFIGAKCGCIMIQYAKEKGIECKFCGTFSFSLDGEAPVKVSLDRIGGLYIGKCMNARVKNFGEAKELAKTFLI